MIFGLWAAGIEARLDSSAGQAHLTKATDALILLRQLHPTKHAEDFHKDTLVTMSTVYDRMAAVAQQDPQLAATVVEWVMQGQMSASLMKTSSPFHMISPELRTRRTW